MAWKVMLKIMTMSDEKTKKKAIEAAADVYGVDSIAAELADQKLTIIGERNGYNCSPVARKLKKVGKN